MDKEVFFANNRLIWSKFSSLAVYLPLYVLWPRQNVALCERGRFVGYLHMEKPPGEIQELFATRTVRTYVRIVPNWTLQQSLA